MDTNIAQKLSAYLRKSNQSFIGLYFFGSRTQNKAHSDSDYDFVAVFKKVSIEDERRIYTFLSDIMYEYDVFIDLKILTESDFRRNHRFSDQVTQTGIIFK